MKWLRRKKKKNGEPLSQNYVHKILKTSRQVFAFAVANELLQINPLAGIFVPEQVDEDRDFEITPAMTTKILDAANPKYRLIIALARYGGLRCPSELAGLCWSHFLWDQDRFQRELERLRDYEFSAVVCENLESDLLGGAYGRMSGKSIKATLVAWMTRYPTHWVFCPTLSWTEKTATGSRL